MKAAYLIDGGFFIKKFKQENSQHPTAQDVRAFIDKFHAKYAQPAEIFRIYYYNCP
jgi:hypothetical protein